MSLNQRKKNLLKKEPKSKLLEKDTKFSVKEVIDIIKEDLGSKLNDVFTPQSLKEIKEAEKKAGVKFPPEYITFLTTIGYDEYTSLFGSINESSLKFNVNNNLLEEFKESNKDAIPDKGIKKLWWNPKWWPIGEFGSGDCLFIDFDPAPGGVKGQVGHFSHDDGHRKLISNSIEEYLNSKDFKYAYKRLLKEKGTLSIGTAGLESKFSFFKSKKNESTKQNTSKKFSSILEDVLSSKYTETDSHSYLDNYYAVYKKDDSNSFVIDVIKNNGQFKIDNGVLNPISLSYAEGVAIYKGNTLTLKEFPEGYDDYFDKMTKGVSIVNPNMNNKPFLVVVYQTADETDFDGFLGSAVAMYVDETDIPKIIQLTEDVMKDLRKQNSSRKYPAYLSY